MELSERRSLPFGLLLLLSCFILIFAYIRWEEVVVHHPDGSYSLKDEVGDKANDRVDRLRNRTEFYMLVARSDAYYICPLCPPEASSNGRFFLYYKQVYKVGVSMTPKSRYTKAELDRWNLDYVRVAVGGYTEMQVLETEFMATYPLHPDNMSRPKYRRLVTPPGSGTRLR